MPETQETLKVKNPNLAKEYIFQRRGQVIQNCSLIASLRMIYFFFMLITAKNGRIGT